MAAEKDAKSGAEPEELPEEPACFKVCRMAEAEAFLREYRCHDIRHLPAESDKV